VTKWSRRLDVSVQGTVLNLLKKYSDENEAGLIFVSHGLPATAFVSKDIVVMRNGVIVEQGSVDDVIHHSKNPTRRPSSRRIRGRLVP